MPRPEMMIPPVFLTVLKDGTDETDFTAMLQSSFEVTKYLDFEIAKAAATNCTVVITVGLIPTEVLYPQSDDQEKENKNE